MPDAGRIILVRHGETEANRAAIFAASEDICLTDTGRAQAAQLALQIEQRYRPTKIFSSEYLRARQTAEIIAAHLGLPVQTLPGIHEREFGALRGQSYEQMGVMMLNDAAYDPERRWLWSPSSGESLEAVQTRVVRALAGLQKAHPSEKIIVVSHGAVMECVAAHIAGEWQSASVPPNCGVLELSL